MPKDSIIQLKAFQLPDAAESALLFLVSGEFLLVHRDEDKLSQKFVAAQDVISAFSQREFDTDWIDVGGERIRFGYGRYGPWYLWRVPHKTARITIEGVGELTIPLPPLYMGGNKKGHTIVATKEPYADLPRIWAAPFPNTARGDICWGNNRPPKTVHQNAQETWGLYISSPFSGHSVQGVSRSHPRDVRLFLKSLDGKRRFPMGDLIPYDGYACSMTAVLRRLKGEK